MSEQPRRDPRPSARITIPPPQQHLQTAQQKSIEALAGQSETQYEWLGAERSGTQWRLPVMDGVFLVDPKTGDVRRDDGEQVNSKWLLVTLHYLAVRTRPIACPPEITFATLPSARVYASVYQNRVNGRFCATVGKDSSTLQSAAAAVGAHPIDGGDVSYEVTLFPRIPMRLIWYAGDGELTPSCTLLLPPNIESFLCTEDIVVLSESFVSRMSGRPF